MKILRDGTYYALWVDSIEKDIIEGSYIKLEKKINGMKKDIQQLKETFNYFPVADAINEILERWDK